MLTDPAVSGLSLCIGALIPERLVLESYAPGPGPPAECTVDLSPLFPVPKPNICPLLFPFEVYAPGPGVSILLFMRERCDVPIRVVGLFITVD